jgi:hypothetical protein
MEARGRMKIRRRYRIVDQASGDAPTLDRPAIFQRCCLNSNKLGKNETPSATGRLLIYKTCPSNVFLKLKQDTLKRVEEEGYVWEGREE